MCVSRESFVESHRKNINKLKESRILIAQIQFEELGSQETWSSYHNKILNEFYKKQKISLRLQSTQMKRNKKKTEKKEFICATKKNQKETFLKQNLFKWNLNGFAWCFLLMLLTCVMSWRKRGEKKCNLILIAVLKNIYVEFKTQNKLKVFFLLQQNCCV